MRLMHSRKVVFIWLLIIVMLMNNYLLHRNLQNTRYDLLSRYMLSDIFDIIVISLQMREWKFSIFNQYPGYGLFQFLDKILSNIEHATYHALQCQANLNDVRKKCSRWQNVHRQQVHHIKIYWTFCASLRTKNPNVFFYLLSARNNYNGLWCHFSQSLYLCDWRVQWKVKPQLIVIEL